MGAYINPPDESKEAFLEREGADLFLVDFKSVPEGHLAVCLVDNGLFTAAGIAFDEREFNEFAREDGRRKYWFTVPIEKLQAVSSDLKYYLR